MSSNHTDDVLTEVKGERDRQDTKWGEQNHPDISPRLHGLTHEEIAHHVGIRPADDAKAHYEKNAVSGQLSFTDVLIEEVAEAVEAASEYSEDELREELVQVAAVALVWIEAIDRRNGKG